MRIVAAHPGPSFSVHDVHAGWTEALRGLGNPVAEFNLDDRLNLYTQALVPIKNPDGTEDIRRALSNDQAVELAANGLYANLYRLRPDLLFVTYPYFYPMELFDIARQWYGTKVVFVHTESPFEDDKQLKLAAHADLNIINDPCNLEKFREIAPTYYMGHSYRPSLHKPGEIKKELAADLAFIGTGFPSRIEFLEAMDFDGLDFFLGGSWHMLKKHSNIRKFLAHESDVCLDNEQTVDVYRSSRMGLNLYRKEIDLENDCLDEVWSCGPREIEMAATGLFFLRQSHGESDDLFPMLPTFSSPGEASEMVRWWLSHDDLRHEAADQARARIADRTFENRAVELMQLLDK